MHRDAVARAETPGVQFERLASEGIMEFFSKRLRLPLFGICLAWVCVRCGEESSNNPFEPTDAGRGGNSSSGGTGGAAGSAGSGGAGGDGGAKGGAGSGGGTSTTTGAAGNGGAGGGAGKGGSAGNTGTGGSAGTAGTDGDAGVGDPCGGLTGGVCSSATFCDFAPLDCASPHTVGGACRPKPDGCTKDCPGVCGCDGKFYCNACVAHTAGVDVTADTTCMRSPDAGAD
jgi:hypothetical protein